MGLRPYSVQEALNLGRCPYWVQEHFATLAVMARQKPSCGALPGLAALCQGHHLADCVAALGQGLIAWRPDAGGDDLPARRQQTDAHHAAQGLTHVHCACPTAASAPMETCICAGGCACCHAIRLVCCMPWMLRLQCLCNVCMPSPPRSPPRPACHCLLRSALALNCLLLMCRTSICLRCVLQPGGGPAAFRCPLRLRGLAWPLGLHGILAVPGFIWSEESAYFPTVSNLGCRSHASLGVSSLSTKKKIFFSQ